ncbi:MAG: type II toxin-antitoxin system RelE/ParE family toxin [Planctomycetia bacterium]
MIIEIREQAREDLQLGFRFYEEQATGLGRHFLECLFVDIESLTRFAGIHETVDGFERLLSKRFPFAIYSTVVGDRVRVSAVLDCRRDPFWIKRRLRQADDG